MKTVDSIVKGVLLRRNYPMHWYLQYLVSARDIIQEMIIDDGLTPPNTVILQLDEFGAATLPCDYQDWTKVGIRIGEVVRPLVHSNSLMRIPKIDSSGNQVPYISTSNEYRNYAWGYLPGMYFSTNVVNDYGEYTARNYGAGAGYETDVFTIIPERNIIQCSEYYKCKIIVLEYISTCEQSISTVGIDPNAEECIKAYIIFDMTRNKRGASLGEIQMAENEYIKQRKRFRARKNTLDIEVMRRLIQRAYYESPKV